MEVKVTLKIKEEVHKELSIIKAELGVRTLSEAIEILINKGKNDNANKSSK